MIEEKFALGSSVLHRMNPVARITAALFLSVSTALCDRLEFCMIYFLTALILVWLAKLDIKAVFGRVKPVAGFLAMIWVLIPLTFDAEPFVRLAGIHLSMPGIMLCAKISVKSITILLVFISLVATMTVATLGYGLQRLRVPDKMVFLLLMAYRYIAVIESEYHRLRRAASFRGFVARTDLHSYRTIAYLAGMLFVRASLRANRVYQAMICRGFHQKFHTLERYRVSRLNLVFVLLVTFFCIFLTVMERTGCLNGC